MRFMNWAQLTGFVRLLLWANILYSILGAGITGLEIQILQEVRDTQPNISQALIDRAIDSDMRQQLMGVIGTILLVITTVFFLTWVRRAGKRTRQLGAEGLKISDGWAIGWYFVPIMNLWKPYQAMVEIYRSSIDPVNWASLKRDDQLPLWWGLWIASNVLGQVILRTAFSEELDQIILSSYATLGSDLLNVALCLTFLPILKTIFESQNATEARLRREGQDLTDLMP